MIGLGLSDASFLKHVEPIIKSEIQPVYIFMIILTSHGPFNITKKYRELVLDKNLDETKLCGYFQSIHYTNKQIGTLLEKLI
jgi:lipoteichoic acid synthase